MNHINGLFRTARGRSANVQHYCARISNIRPVSSSNSPQGDDGTSPSDVTTTEEKPKTLDRWIRKPGDLGPYKMPDEDPDIKKEHVFQELKKIRMNNPIFTLEEAAEYVYPDFTTKSYKYPKLTENLGNYHYSMRSWENEYSMITQMPDVTDFIVVGAGLVGSAAAYYMKRTVSICCDVLVIDRDPYGPNSATAICPGLISCQSKSRDISRMAQLTKELIRNLRRDIMINEADWAQIKYRPCTHLILWPENEAEEAFEAASSQIEDGCFTEIRLPHELESIFPWLQVVDSGVSIGTHGIQDEALIDPIGLRNLYRTIGQARGVNYLQAEMVDFNTQHTIQHAQIKDYSASSIVVRVGSGELRACHAPKTLLTCGHNVPFLESRAETEEEIRDSIQDMHFLQPKLRVCVIFKSLAAPVINFPVITDTDGSMLLRDDLAGTFKYYLTMDECEILFDEDNERYMNLEVSDPYISLFHRDSFFKNYFNNTIKPKLVKRIPVMEDAEFLLAHSGFETYNTFDGNPVITMHPFLKNIVMASGFGRRLSTLGVVAGASLSELVLEEETELFDVSNFYWDRVMSNRRIQEFRKLIN